MISRKIDRRFPRSIPADVSGLDELDAYGRWSTAALCGAVWFPTGLAAGWAPYRNGSWVWIDPWGWSWLGAEPWGWAPFHYGRWDFIDGAWGWCPGTYPYGAIYAPALVTYIGGPTWGWDPGGWGWFPIGWGEPFVPAYAVGTLLSPAHQLLPSASARPAHALPESGHCGRGDRGAGDRLRASGARFSRRPPGPSRRNQVGARRGSRPRSGTDPCEPRCRHRRRSNRAVFRLAPCSLDPSRRCARPSLGLCRLARSARRWQRHRAVRCRNRSSPRSAGASAQVRFPSDGNFDLQPLRSDLGRNFDRRDPG